MGRRKHKKFKIHPVLVDIVIPVHKKLDFLERCLDCIPEAAGDVSYHIWIHDNGTPKEEKEWYSNIRDRKDITLIQTSQGVGYPKACNVAANRGNAPLIMILTHDVFLKKDAISELVKVMDEPKNGMAGMKLLFPEGSPHGPEETVQHSGIELNIRVEPFHQFIGWSPDHPKVMAKTSAFAVTGAAFIIRRPIWKKVGGFFLGYGLGTYEDMELCVQVRNLGYNIAIAQNAVGYHWVGGSEQNYPLNQNRGVFLSRCGQFILWDEWRWW